MGVTFDAGPLVALDRYDLEMWRRLKVLVAKGLRPTVPAPVVTEVWRTPRQSNLARALRHCRIEDTDEVLAREAGALLGASGVDDPVDAIVVASAARRRDVVYTSDPDDVDTLAAATSGVSVFGI